VIQSGEIVIQSGEIKSYIEFKLFLNELSKRIHYMNFLKAKIIFTRVVYDSGEGRMLNVDKLIIDIKDISHINCWRSHLYSSANIYFVQNNINCKITTPII